MANPSASIHISLGALEVGIELENVYPDALVDMVNRIAVLLGTSLAEAKAAGIDIMAVYKSSFVEGDDDEDEEEDA